jgi:hypothetical protein
MRGEDVVGKVEGAKEGSVRIAFTGARSLIFDGAYLL